MPTSSIPRIRGNLTSGEWPIHTVALDSSFLSILSDHSKEKAGLKAIPCLVNISLLFSPHALTRINTSPSVGTGTGTLSTLSTSGPPASRITAAFIVSGSRLLSVESRHDLLFSYMNTVRPKRRERSSRQNAVGRLKGTDDEVHGSYRWRPCGND